MGPRRPVAAVYKARLKVSIPSRVQPGLNHPVGTEVQVIEKVEPNSWFCEIRIPDDALPWGARYDIVVVPTDDLEV